MNDFERFEQLISGGHCCISIVTHEERYALETSGIVSALAGSPPLSVTMAERVEWLRGWADGRCVPAD